MFSSSRHSPLELVLIGFLLLAAGLLVLASAPAALGADRVYWGNDNDTISYANLDGSGGGAELDLSGATPSRPRGVAIDPAAGRIYWANQNNGTISYANLDGSGGGGELNIAGATATEPHGLAIDPAAGRIYWANDDNTIAYANLDGSGGALLGISGATPSEPYGLAIDPAAGRIYWANRVTDTISYANLDGSGEGGELNISGAPSDKPHGVVIDGAGGRVLWTNLNSTISFANLDGSGGGGLLNLSGATQSGGIGMAIDPAQGRIYWGNLGFDSISYVNLDGSGGGGLLDTTGATLSNPRFVALLRAPSGAGAPAISAGDQLEDGLSCSRGEWAPNLLGEFLYRAPRSFAYQWLLDGADVPGADKATFTPVESGSYACRVTASNDAGPGSQTSAAHPVQLASEFGFGDVKRLKRKGKARIEVELPFAGVVELASAGDGAAASASGATVKPRRKSADAPGVVNLNVAPQGKTKQELRRKGKVKVGVEATFSSDGGALATKSTTVKLKLKQG